MSPAARPHVLGIDDGPFEKRQRHPVPVVAVLMEGADLVEGVAVERFPVDGADATDFVAGWVEGLRFRDGMQAVVLGGITLAGLGVVDPHELARRLALPVLVTTRRDPARSRLCEALLAAGLEDRLSLVERAPPAVRQGDGLYLAVAGALPGEAKELLQATVRKAKLPEPLRVAHLIARALVSGESRGRA